MVSGLVRRQMPRRGACEAVAGVDVMRRDPELPEVEVRYGMSLGVMCCTAALHSLAIRVPLEPPFAP